MTPLTTREASAHVAIQDAHTLLKAKEALYFEVEHTFWTNMRAFRARCPVATCRRVLTASPWRGGVRSVWCRCGHGWRECSLELEPAVLE